MPGGGRHAPFFFVDPDAIPGPGAGERLRIAGVDARHLAVVRRAHPGDAIVVSDGQGRLVEARLTSVAPAMVEAAVEADHRVPAPAPAVDVVQGLAKGEKVDQVIRQLVELGVDGVTVFEAGRSVAKWDPSRAAAAHDRWAAIAREAAKQSHRAWLPGIAGPVALGEAAARAGQGGGPGGGEALGLIAHPAARQTLRAILDAAVPAGPGSMPRRVWLVIGPEGGLSDRELDAFVAAGGTPVSAGDQILRTETASIVLASLVLYWVGRFG